MKNNANPEFNEEFYLVVDDLREQMLTIKVGRGVWVGVP
jgi:Ca2+-dependent lipid-binding protein